MAADHAKLHPVRSSVPYQLLLFVNIWAFVIIWICEVLLYIYKGIALPYPSSTQGLEIGILIVLAILEIFRISAGMQGNLTEHKIATIWSFALSLCSIACCLYFLLWQTYVLRAEVILVSVLLGFIGLELILGIIALITFARAPAY